jgi:glucose-1-phosphate thymidylyltransferase
VGSPEEVAWRQGWINDEQLEKLAQPLKKSGYGTYLMRMLNDAMPLQPTKGSLKSA